MEKKSKNLYSVKSKKSVKEGNIMPLRTLEPREYKIIKEGIKPRYLKITNCKEPKNWNNVIVNIRVGYLGGGEGQFMDNIDIKNGKADHEKKISGYSQEVDWVNVVIQWQ